MCFLLLGAAIVCLGQDITPPPKPSAMVSSRSVPSFPALVHNPSGTFAMGNPIEKDRSDGYRRSEKPKHELTVREFWLGRFIVTAEEYCQFLNDVGNHGYFIENTGWVDGRTITVVKENGETSNVSASGVQGSLTMRRVYRPQPGADRCPAYPVTWTGAVNYCRWLSEKLGHTFRLPSEAEWEFAARGQELRRWPWGDAPPLWGKGAMLPDEIREMLPADLGPNHRISWPPRAQRLCTIAARPDPPFRVPASFDVPIPFYQLHGIRWMYTGKFDEKRAWARPPVGSFPLNATPGGVYDMLGYRVGQWCQDIYDERGYGNFADKRGSDEARVMRGMSTIPIDTGVVSLESWILRWLPIGDAKAGVYRTIPGRAWSRIGGHPRESGGMFRVACDGPMTVGQSVQLPIPNQTKEKLATDPPKQ